VLGDKELEPMITIAAQVIREDDAGIVEGATVELITFAEEEQHLVTDASGEVTFSLPEGTPYMLVYNNDERTGMYTGTVDDQAVEANMTHQVMIREHTASQVPVAGLITDQDGYLLDEVLITVTAEGSEESIELLTKKGVFSFLGEEGKEYDIEVKHPESSEATTKVSVTVGSEELEKLEIVLEEESPLIDILAQVVKEADGMQVEGATVELVTFTEDEEELITNASGKISFSLPQGTPYLLVSSKGNLTGMYTGTVEEQLVEANMVHQVMIGVHTPAQVPVAGLITDEDGYLLDEVLISVSAEGSEESIELLTKKGVFSFPGEPGKTYDIEVMHPELSGATTTASITVGSEDVEKIEIMLDEEAPQIELLAQVLREKDGTIVEGATVELITFTDEEQQLVTDTSGEISFTLPIETPYLLVCSKDDLTGMHTGTVDEQSGKEHMTHQVMISVNTASQVPVAGLITDQDGYLLDEVLITVTAEGSDESMEVMVKKGLFSFLGEPGVEYNIEASVDPFVTQTNTISLSVNEENPNKILLAMKSETNDSDVLEMIQKPDYAEVISVNSEKYDNEQLTATLSGEPSARSKMDMNWSLGSLHESSVLAILNSEDSSIPKLFIISEGMPYELIERDEKLYILDNGQEWKLSDGTLEELINDPDYYLASLGITAPEIISLQNIYFDYNSTRIKAESNHILEKASEILYANPDLHLVISAHADDRGRENYNQRLSKKRGNSVMSFLIKKGVNESTMIARAYGENNPVIPCQVQNCNENDHGKNRRVELALRAAKPVVDLAYQSSSRNIADVGMSPQNEEQREKLSFAEVLAQFGETRINGLVFKISIGAYRYNPNLTFDKLKDLGDIQKKFVGGINYYFLAEYSNLKTAEVIRKKVIDRGVEDAFISIYYNDKIIPFSDYLIMVQNDLSIKAQGIKKELHNGSSRN